MVASRWCVLVVLASLFGACAEPATVNVEVSYEPSPDLAPAPAPSAPCYAYATPSRPACRRLEAATLAACVAAFGDQGAPSCITDPQFGHVTCTGGLFLQRELDGNYTAFKGQDFAAELTAGLVPDVWGVRFANGLQGTCSLGINATLCVEAAPERSR